MKTDRKTLNQIKEDFDNIFFGKMFFYMLFLSFIMFGLPTIFWGPESLGYWIIGLSLFFCWLIRLILNWMQKETEKELDDFIGELNNQPRKTFKERIAEAIEKDKLNQNKS